MSNKTNALVPANGRTLDEQNILQGITETLCLIHQDASGPPVTTDLDTNLPYRQSYGFNAFGNLTQRDNLHWGTDYWNNRSSNLSYTYENNRVTNANSAYDWDGREIQTSGPDDWSSITYDARGMLKTLHSYHPTITTRHYDGYGREGKRERSVWVDNETPPNFREWEEEDDEYFIRSSVLGGAVIYDGEWVNVLAGE